MKKFFYKYKMISIGLVCTLAVTGVMTYSAYSQNKGYTITSQITKPTGDNPEIYTGEEFEVTYTITPEDIPYSSVDKDIMFVLDTSGSMKYDISGKDNGFNRSKLKLIKEASNNFIDKFKVNDGEKINIGIIQYSTYAARVSDLKDISNSANKEVLKSIIGTKESEGFKASGGTNIGDSLRAGYYTLKDSPNNTKGKYMILMTDGKPSSYSYTKSKNDKLNYLGKYISSTLELQNGYPTNSTGNGDEYVIKNSERKDEYYVTSGTYEDIEDETYVSDVINLVNNYNSNNLDSPIQTFILGISGSNVNYVNEMADQLGGKAFFASTASEIDKIYNEIQSIIEKDLISSVTFTNEITQDIEIAADTNELQSITVSQDGKIINFKKDQIGDKLSINAGFNYNQAVNEDGKKVYRATPIEIIIRYKAMASGDFVMDNGKIEVDIPNKGSSSSDIPPISITVKDYPGAAIPVTIQITDSFGAIGDKYNSLEQRPLANRYDKYVSNKDTNENYNIYGSSKAKLEVKKTTEFDKLQYNIVRMDQASNNLEMPTEGWIDVQDVGGENTYSKDIIIGEEQGIYYIAYQCLSGKKTVKSGIYGPMIVGDKISVIRSMAKENIEIEETTQIIYKIVPENINIKDVYKGNQTTFAKKLYVRNFEIQDLIPKELEIGQVIGENAQLINSVDQLNNNNIEVSLNDSIEYNLSNDKQEYVALPIEIKISITGKEQADINLKAEYCEYSYNVLSDGVNNSEILLTNGVNQDLLLSVGIEKETKILGHSIYINNTDGILMEVDEQSYTNVAKDVPLNIGIEINVNAPGNYKSYLNEIRIEKDYYGWYWDINISNVKVYKMKNGQIGEEVTNVWINENYRDKYISFYGEKGINKYLVIYNCIPYYYRQDNRFNQVNIKANMRNFYNNGWLNEYSSSDKSIKLKMEKEEIPDLF